MATMIGKAAVWGIPKEIKPVAGLVRGKLKFKFRRDKPAEVYVRNETGCYRYQLMGLASWMQWDGMLIGANIRPMKNPG